MVAYVTRVHVLGEVIWHCTLYTTQEVNQWGGVIYVKVDIYVDTRVNDIV